MLPLLVAIVILVLFAVFAYEESLSEVKNRFSLELLSLRFELLLYRLLIYLFMLSFSVYIPPCLYSTMPMFHH